MRHGFVNFLPAFLLSAALLHAGCGNRQKKPTRTEAIKAAMEKYFQPPTGKNIGITGLWLAKPESVQKAIEKKFLGNYRPQPDGMPATEIRDRMKSMSMHFRIQENGHLEMLTIAGDSFGPSTGILRRRKGATGAAEIYDAKLSGKGSTSAATFTYRNNSGNEILEYEEGGLIISAARETRPVAELIQLFSEQLSSGTGLSKY
ncbi:MAG: hypothetical protein JNJ69_13690 [Leptospiraceae bacterium]|nr:hypothetical protein [Leptospiraceae bacterium]